MIRNQSRLACLFIGFATLTSAQASAQQCQIHFTDYNLNRALSGSGMNLECPNEASSPPFGTWAVDSTHSGAMADSGQFMGWKNTEGHPDAWNSCSFYGYEAPNCNYYNADFCNSQTTMFGEGIFAAWWSDVLPWPCSDYGNTYSLSGYFMRMWETDDVPFNPDDEAGVLSYPPFDVPLSCDATGYCSGRSGWIDPSSWSRTGNGPDSATAQISVLVELIPQ